MYDTTSLVGTLNTSFPPITIIWKSLTTHTRILTMGDAISQLVRSMTVMKIALQDVLERRPGIRSLDHSFGFGIPSNEINDRQMSASRDIFSPYRDINPTTLQRNHWASRRGTVHRAACIPGQRSVYYIYEGHALYGCLNSHPINARCRPKIL